MSAGQGLTLSMSMMGGRGTETKIGCSASASSLAHHFANSESMTVSRSPMRRLLTHSTHNLSNVPRWATIGPRKEVGMSKFSAFHPLTCGGFHPCGRRASLVRRHASCEPSQSLSVPGPGKIFALAPVDSSQSTTVRERDGGGWGRGVVDSERMLGWDRWPTGMLLCRVESGNKRLPRNFPPEVIYRCYHRDVVTTLSAYR